MKRGIGLGRYGRDWVWDWSILRSENSKAEHESDFPFLFIF